MTLPVAAARCPPPAKAEKGVAKSLKALNHEEHEGHEGKEKIFLVLFVSFVVPFFSEPFAPPSEAGSVFFG